MLMRISLWFFLSHYLLLSPYFVVGLMETLYDAPVSNHGARVRILSKVKNIDLQIKSPADIGGLKSPEYSKLSIQV